MQKSQESVLFYTYSLPLYIPFSIIIPLFTSGFGLQNRHIFAPREFRASEESGLIYYLSTTYPHPRQFPARLQDKKGSGVSAD